MQKILIDCDPGHDDATAILYGAKHLDLVGITTVYGNQTVDKTTWNALSLVSLLGLDVPVARGCEGPLNGVVRHGGDVHGKTGMDGAELPSPDRQVIGVHAVDFIIEMASEHRGELVLIPTGPFTNVAMALRKEPRLTKWLRGISVMGGTTQIGNTTPVSEFNVWCDPEAADIIFRSGVPLWMVGLNVTRQVGVTQNDVNKLLAGGPVAKAYGGLFSFFRDSLKKVHGLSTASLHDPCALVPFIAPEMINYRHCHVEIALGAGPTRGMTVCDMRSLTTQKLENIQAMQAPNCNVAIDVQSRDLVEHILQAIIEWR
ncbi:nucleoside hydrolase [Brucella sp. NBRC 12950]|jgi:inosine-uridine nucleoside N-ribohydrolase|uniref:nucleoside hydrolase n=1 Tax=Brucella sp. NBRC 12950 TaxID=2994518 RepID=UPI0024A152D7|nr:nucleoside hydrolase [Brucella sp. NBRC 12950]GLU29218.1 ribosylpyrimidine nucleosidase [Brucella sp. NBRC 12950]